MEIGGSWRTLPPSAVLLAWAVVGLVLAPILLRRMARRESGSSRRGPAREAAAACLTRSATPMSDSEALYNRIAVLRAERGITRRQLAEAVGVHYQTVGYLERGEYSPSLQLALRIADFFEVPVEAIFSTRPFPRIGQTTADGGRADGDRAVVLPDPVRPARPAPPRRAPGPGRRQRRPVRGRHVEDVHRLRAQRVHPGRQHVDAARR